MHFYASKLKYDVERREKRITDLTAELEVLRKGKQNLEAIFTVRTNGPSHMCLKS